MVQDAYVTLLFNDHYLAGCLVLAHALLQYGTTKSLVVLVTDAVSAQAKEYLHQVYQEIILVSTILNSDPGSLQFKLLDRPELSPSYTKIHAWNLPHYNRIVFLDADTLPLRNIDELFDTIPESSTAGTSKLSAAPDIGWPDIFNSGVFVTHPSESTFEALLGAAHAGLSFDGGDQGLLNQFYGPNWSRLSFLYNVTPSASYQYAPAFAHFGSETAIVHFVGSPKPWNSGHSESTSEKGTSFKNQWWDIFNAHYDYNLILAIESNLPLPATTAQKIVDVAPEPLIEAPILIEPSIDRWDATKYEPPVDSRPEAQTLEIPHFSNTWDIPSEEPDWHVQQALKQVSGVEEHQESVSQHTIHFDPIFPWESDPQTPLVERIFPEDAILGVPESPHSSEHEEVESEDSRSKGEEVQDENSSDGREQFPSRPQTPESSSDLAFFRQSNAWDQDPAIWKYLEQHVGHHHHQRHFNEAAGGVGNNEQNVGGEDSDDDIIDDAVDELNLGAGSSSVHKKIAFPVTPNPMKLRSAGLGGGASDAEDDVSGDETVTWDPDKKLQELAELPLLLAAKHQRELQELEDEIQSADINDTL